MKKALIVVDVQNDFCDGGSLAVPKANHAIPYINYLIKEFKRNKQVIVYTRDWHPEDHCSFKDQGGIWPSHCVKDTDGANFFHELHVSGEIFNKAVTKDQDSYSGFGGKNLKDQALIEFLKENKVTEVVVVGLALDYCVKETALASNKHGLITIVDVKGTRAVNVSPTDGERAINELKSVGVTVLR